jgi:hypothetical protein
MYGEGVSKSGEILDLAVEFEIIKKSGSWFSYGETKLGQGRDAVKNLIQDNPEIGVTANLGKILFNEFALPFEISSVLLLSAMIGAIMLSKKDTKK